MSLYVAHGVQSTHAFKSSEFSRTRTCASWAVALPILVGLLLSSLPQIEGYNPTPGLSCSASEDAATFRSCTIAEDLLPRPGVVSAVLATNGTRKAGGRVEYRLSLDALGDLAGAISPLPLRFASVLVAEPVSASDSQMHQDWHADDSVDTGALRAIVYLSDVGSPDAGALEFSSTFGDLSSTAVIGRAGTVSADMCCTM